MQSSDLRCAHCGNISAAGTAYCPRCGQPIAPDLVREAQWLYAMLADLDARIAVGEGDRPLRALRGDYEQRYNLIRTPRPVLTTTGTAIAASVPTGAPAAAGAPIAPANMLPSSLSQTASTSAAQLASAPSATPTAEPTGPIFSWRAFFAEQAIAILAYLGGFLLLVATLSFELGAGIQLDNTPKLLIVVVVYLLFGVAGFRLFREPQLRTVGNAYLGVFALMTPLVGLAVYLFVLNGLHVPAAAMLSLTAFYAAIVYLALAWQTDFFTYAVLGWTALIVGCLAVVPWSAEPQEWYIPALTGAAIVLAAIRLLPLPGTIARGALILGAIIAPLAGFATVLLGLYIWAENRSAALDPNAYTLAAMLVLPLALIWNIRARQEAGPAIAAGGDRLAWLDCAVAAAAAQTVIAIAAHQGADTRAMANILAAVAVAESGAALVARLIAPAARATRWGLYGLALTVGGVGIILGNTLANHWPLVIGFLALAFVATVIAFAEDLPAWLIGAGGALAVTFWQFLGTFPPPPELGQPGYEPALLVARPEVAATLVFAAIALGLTWVPRAQRYAVPVAVVALGNSLWTSVLLFALITHGVYLTGIGMVLAVFALLGYLFGIRQRSTLTAGLLLAGYGLLAISYLLFGTFLPQSEPNEVYLNAGIALAPIMLGIAAQRVGNRSAWSVGFYVIGGWSILLAALLYQLKLFGVGFWNAVPIFLGVPFAAWFLLIAGALVVFATLGSSRAAVQIFPTVLLLLAVISARPFSAHWFDVGLVFLGVGVGLGWRVARSVPWSIAWYLVAGIAGWVALARISDLGAGSPYWQAGFSLVFAALAYAIARMEAQPVATGIALLYGITAILLLPIMNIAGLDGLDAFGGIPLLAIILLTASVGVVLSRRWGYAWSAAPYGIAVVASFIAARHISTGDANHLQTLFLGCAALAYTIALRERQSWAGAAASFYALLAAVSQPDAGNLLALALILAIVGLVSGRVGGIRWSWPAYLAAATVGAFAAARGGQGTLFEAAIFAALALMMYVVAAIEARPQVLIGTFVLGALGLSALINAEGWTASQGVLLFALLGSIDAGLSFLWGALPWLPPPPPVSSADNAPRWMRDPRQAGVILHRWASILIVSGAGVAAIFAHDAFTPQQAPAQSAAIVLLTLASLLMLYARLAPLHILWYVAGFILSIFLTWEVRWFGADNIQAFILAPGSYLLLIGAILPADLRLGRQVMAGQICSVLGALVLLLPTLGQSFLNEQSWIYAFVLAAEAIVITVIGVGTRTRLITLTGVAFVGLAAIRSGVVAVNSGVPIAIVIALYALLLMGAATWLSLRNRRESTAS